MAGLAVLFAMPVERFAADVWPDRARVELGDAARFAVPPAELARIVARELALEFAAPGVRGGSVTRAAGSRVDLDRHARIIAVQSGRSRCTLHEGAAHELSVGAAMFVPRGGAVIDALEDTVSIEIALAVPTWSEMITNTLVHELAVEDAWRAPHDPREADDLAERARVLAARLVPPSRRRQ